MSEAPQVRTRLARVWLVPAFALATAGPLAGHAAAAGLVLEPIIDTHVHLYQVSRPGGVPWPKAANKTLYRDVTPAAYKALAKQHGIIAAGVVEASPLPADNFKLLDSIKNDEFFTFVVAQLEVGSADFGKNLEALAKDPRVVGIRAFDWDQKLTLDAKQIENLKDLAARGMTLDIVSRGNVNPVDKLEKLADAVPDLRIIVDHLAGAKGESPEQAWLENMQRLATHKNVFVKFSSFFDMFNPTASEEQPWESPRTVGAYKEGFDWLMGTFGAERVMFGSNWPVAELGGTFTTEIQLAETYLEPLGKRVRNKVMYQNAERFYRRVLPRHEEVRISKETKPERTKDRLKDRKDRATDRTTDRTGDRKREAHKRDARHISR
jgi:L-fuconolactonase